MLRKLKTAFAVLCLAAMATTSTAQQGTLEMTSSGSSTSAYGPRITSVPVIFREDIQNLTFGTHFRTNTPALTATTSLVRQQFTGTYASNVSTGMIFGAGSTGAFTPGQPQQAEANPVYNALGATLTGPPQNGMFVSSPTGTIVSNWQAGGRGVGLDPEGTQNGFDDDLTSFDYSFGVAVYTTVEPLKTFAKDGRYYYGDIVIKFSRPIVNPVVHVGGLGGSYNYIPVGSANPIYSFFSTELELQNQGVTSTFMAGSEYLNVVGNNILNSAPFPNGASTAGPSYGAASGSIRLNGVMDSLVYKVYVRGSVNSQFSFSATQAQIAGAFRSPFNGDLFYLAVSLNKPTQQISGSVFIDKDVSDNNIHTSFGLPNDRTNAGGTLHANLISGGLVIATIPINVNGDYLFDNVPMGTYTVQVGTTPGVVGNPPPLPANWSRTGEFIGAGAGNDGNANGTSASFSIAANGIQNNVDFGIRSGLCAGNVLYANPVGPTDYFGGFEITPTANNFYPNGVNLSSGPGRLYAQTPLTAANYSVTNDPSSFDNLLSSFKALGGNSQLVVKPTANQVVYYLVDSAGIHASGPAIGRQAYFTDGPKGASFKGWFANTSGTNAIVKIKIYNAEIPSVIYLNEDVTVTGSGANSWTYWNKPWEIPLNAPKPKKLRFDIISVNGAPFTIDDLCFVEPQLSPLQITLSDFTVSKSACTANLVWKTSSESNSDRFEVEVATNGSANYSKMGTVAASGSSSTEKTYQYSYDMQPGTIYYFRLKMIDKDGAFKYSDIRSASCNYKGGIVIAPNPVIKSFTIKGMEAGRNVITIFADNGQLVKTQVSAQVQEVIDISNLAPGLYAVKVMSEKGNMVVEKIIKK